MITLAIYSFTAYAESQVHLYLYSIFYQRRVDIIDQKEYRVHDRLQIYPLCGIFYFYIDTR